MASTVTSLQDSLRAGVIPVVCSTLAPFRNCCQSTSPGASLLAAEFFLSYSTEEGLGAAPASRKYRPARPSVVQTTLETSTPCSRAWLSILLPSAFLGSLVTHDEVSPSLAAPTATLSSAPPMTTSRLVAC